MSDNFFDPADTTPRRKWLETRREIATAAQGMMGVAQRQIRCADRDLAVFDLSHSDRIEAMSRLLLSHRTARIQLLVDDVAWLERGAPRLRQLQRRFAHGLQMRLTASNDPVGDESFLMADSDHLLIHHRVGEHTGKVWFNNPLRARSWMQGFDRRWQTAAHDLPVAPLGL